MAFPPKPNSPAPPPPSPPPEEPSEETETPKESEYDSIDLKELVAGLTPERKSELRKILAESEGDEKMTMNDFMAEDMMSSE